MGRIAILSDIHGNPLALQAALADIQSLGGVDETWLLGDYAAIGYDPVGALEMLTALPNARFIRGNTDHYLVGVDPPWPDPEEAKGDAELFKQILQVGRSFAWTAGAVTSAGRLPWLAALPLDFRLTLPDGTRLLAVHAAPGTDDGNGIHPYTPEKQILLLLEGAGADIILVGHTHLPFDRQVGGVRLVNPGSVSNPLPPDLRACYALLETQSDGYEIQFRGVEYDRQAVIEATRRVQHPAEEYLISFMLGRRVPEWLKPHLP